MKNRTYILALIILFLLSLTVVGVRGAQAQDEPTPGVARVSLINGDVSTMRGDTGDWVATTVNTPLVGGDRVTTGERSRTEVQLDYANTLRLDQRSEAKLAELTRTHIQVQLAQGLLDFTVMNGTEADVEIDTPNMAVHPLGEGVYRIQVNSPSETQLIVRNGQAEVSTPQGSTVVEKGKLITVEGVDNPEYQIVSAPRRDDWDKWNQERDDQIADAQSWRYANRYYTGSEDLDQYGHWVSVPGYDWCWTPYVNMGWVPYRDGRWIWEPYWGWTWVSYEPWGWAPYHYGRWFLYSNSWYWWPGYSYYGYYPTWAPAYVSFIGFGFGGRNWHFGFGFGFGSIGWLPLGPYDHYHPWYGSRYRNTYNVVNITNVTNVTNGGAGVRVRNTGNQPYVSNVQQALTNTRVREAITTASTTDFVNGRVQRNPRAVDLQTLRQADVVRGALPAVPTRESLRPSDRAVNTAALPSRAVNNETFFTRRQPPAASESFTARAAEVQQMVERHNPLQAEARGLAARGTSGATSSAVSAERSAQRVATPSAAARTENVNRGAAASETAAVLSNRSREASGAQAGAARPAVTGAANAEARANRPATGQAPAAASSERPGWQQFGSPRAAGPVRASAGVSPAGQETAQRNSPATAQKAQQPHAQPTQPTSSQGWQRFGTGQPRALPEKPTTTGAPAAARSAPTTSRQSSQERPPVAVNVPSQSQSKASAPQSVQSRSAPASTSGSSSGLKRFGSESGAAPAERRGTTSPARSAPQPAPRQAEPSGSRSFQSRSAPAQRSENQGGWQRFTPQSRPAAAERSASPAAPREMRSSPSRDAPVYRRAPRTNQRPPLEIRKPIVTERPQPRSRSFSAPSRGSYGAPSSRSYSAPSSRSYSAPSSRSYGGGWSRGGGGGGGRQGGSASAHSSRGGRGGRR
jgi:hypothetical protein